jgi:hypothetical protein
MVGEEAVIGGAMGLSGVLLVLWFLFFIFVVGIGIASFVFWIMMLIDVVQRKFPEENDKIIWVLVVIFAQIIGALIYYFVVKRKGNGKVK